MPIRTPLKARASVAVPREIASDVYCIAAKGRFDANVYFVRSGSSWALIDTGWGKDAPAIQQAAQSVFGPGARPASILLTHHHPDHAGSAFALARFWRCAVYLHPDELLLAHGDWSAIARFAGPLDRWLILPVMRAMGRRRLDAMLSAASLRGVAHALDPRGEIPGLPGWKCICTAGHTPGHVSFFRPSDRILITGDALVNLRLNSFWGLVWRREGLSGPPWYTTWNWRAAKQSVAALAKLDAAVLASGHGVPVIGTDTSHAVRAFAERFS